MIGAFDSMRQSLLDGPLGETVRVNGEHIRVLLDRFAAQVGEYGQLAGRRIEIQFDHCSIRPGDEIEFDMQTYVLDTPVDDDGLFQVWTVRKL